MKEINKNIIMEKNRIFTVSEYNKSVYGEKIRNYSGKYLREWNPKRSKLAAAIIKGLKEIPLNKNTNVLYLGASTGTTVSHVSDICYNGKIFAVEFAYDPFVKLYNLAKIRSNIFPILDDANMPEKYRFFVDKINFIYQDIAQRNQVDIFNKNADLFTCAKYAMLILKLKSISSRKNERFILNNAIRNIKNFKIMEIIDLRPFDSGNFLLSMVRH